jgi:DNA-binding response OmpR family regulator
VARVRAVLRRSASSPARGNGGHPPLSAGPLRLEPDTRDVTLNGKTVELTAREFDLLKRMMSHPNRVFTRESLLENIWGYDYFGSTRTVDMHISRLREKIEDDPASPTFIVTVRGVGYKFRPAADAPPKKARKPAR